MAGVGGRGATMEAPPGLPWGSARVLLPGQNAAEMTTPPRPKNSVPAAGAVAYLVHFRGVLTAPVMVD